MFFKSFFYAPRALHKKGSKPHSETVGFNVIILADYSISKNGAQ